MYRKKVTQRLGTKRIFFDQSCLNIFLFECDANNDGKKID
jgi:hypothetical protein